MRRDAYLAGDERVSHDLALPFRLVKGGLRAVYVPEARASERMVPTIEGEWARKRRMMAHAWPMIARGGLLNPIGYPPLYALMIASHRLLRYAAPLLHLLALAASLALSRRRLYRLAALAAALAAGRRRRGRPREGAAAAGRALLRAHHRLDRRRPARLAAPRHPAGMGCRGGDAVSYPGKRLLDVAIAGGALLVSSPLLALAAVAIRLESAGHPIYRQRRVGRDGRAFEVYKLRTMVTGAEGMGAGLAVDEGDDRITRVGAFLRRTSLDELPNLINVLRGEMSIVGPRPTVQVQVDRYTERQRGRLAARPGITGWAQVQGRASLPWPERIELDLWYIEHESLLLDLRVLWLTARMVLTGHGLYRGETGGWRDTPPEP